MVVILQKIAFKSIILGCHGNQIARTHIFCKNKIFLKNFDSNKCVTATQMIILLINLAFQSLFLDPDGN